MSSKSVPARVSSKRVKSERPTRVSSKSVLQECQARVFYKSVKQECLTRLSIKSVLQMSQVRVSNQCVMSGLTTSMSRCIAFLPQGTCQHSGSWVSFCFFSACFQTFHISLQFVHRFSHVSHFFSICFNICSSLQHRFPQPLVSAGRQTGNMSRSPRPILEATVVE